MLLVLTRVFRPLEVIDLICLHLKSKAKPAMTSVVTSEIVLFLTIGILVKGLLKKFYV